LLRLSDGTAAYAVSDVYMYRFMENQDYEMEASGLGHLAGVYGSAIDVLFLSGLGRRRLRLSIEKCEVISD
jgi:hypothetical protein